MIKYDLLVYLGLIPLVAVIVFSGFVVWKTRPLPQKTADDARA